MTCSPVSFRDEENERAPGASSFMVFLLTLLIVMRKRPPEGLIRKGTAGGPGQRRGYKLLA
jgi:hypothetical protein